MTGRLKVVHILAELKPSGAEGMLRCAAPYFSAAGMESDILGTGAVPGVYAPVLEQAGYRVQHLAFSKSLLFFWQLFRFLKAGRYDVVHLHVERGNFYFGLIALLTGKRVVRTVHSTFNFEGALRWRRCIQRQVLERLGVIHVAIGPSVREAEHQRFGIKPEMVENWYDSDQFHPPSQAQQQEARHALGIGRDEFVIATVGNCSELKNHEALIRALAAIPKEMRPVYLHVGIEDDDESERALARSLGIAESVRFMGRQEQVGAVLAAADLYVMPSLNEGFGIAALEALALSMPALLSDVAGLRDFGRVFPGVRYCGVAATQIHETLAEMVAVGGETLRESAKSHARLARELYGIERGVDGYVGLYTATKKSNGNIK